MNLHNLVNGIAHSNNEEEKEKQKWKLFKFNEDEFCAGVVLRGKNFSLL